MGIGGKKRLIGAGLLLCALAVPVGGSPAAAHHCGGSADLTDLGGQASAECHGREPGREPTTALSEEGQWDRYCTYQIDTGSQVAYAGGATVSYSYQGDVGPDRLEQLGYDPTGTYGSFIAFCTHPDPGGSGVGGEFFYTITPPVPVELLRDRAQARIIIDPPVIETNPSFTDRFTVVNVDTWLWVDRGYWDLEPEDDETAGIVTVRVWAETVRVSWDFFDPAGTTTTCPDDDPGTPWTPGATTECFVVFERASAGELNNAFQGESTVYWQFYWSINGADQGPFDPLFEATTPFELQVGEIQAVES